MAGATIGEINEPNRWRLETPGHSGWKRTARPDDPDKFLMISADCHCIEPSNSGSIESIANIATACRESKSTRTA